MEEGFRPWSGLHRNSRCRRSVSERRRGGVRVLVEAAFVAIRVFTRANLVCCGSRRSRWIDDEKGRNDPDSLSTRMGDASLPRRRKCDCSGSIRCDGSPSRTRRHPHPGIRSEAGRLGRKPSALSTAQIVRTVLPDTRPDVSMDTTAHDRARSAGGRRMPATAPHTAPFTA